MNSISRSMALRRCQHGAVTVYVVLAIGALLTGAFAAFEVGRIYLANRQIQKLASLAALDAVREVSACERAFGTTPEAIRTQLEQRVDESLLRNGSAELVGKLTILIETGELEAVPVTVNGNAMTLRRLAPSAESDIASADAIRVTLTAPFPTMLTQFLSNDAGKRMEVSATAEQPLLGTFSVGSGLASLNEGALNAVLGPLLGSPDPLDLSLVDFNGLADANVTAEALALALGVTVKDLSDPLALEVQSPVLSNVLGNLADNLSGTVSDAAVDAIRDLADAAASTETFSIDQLLGGLGGVSPDATVGNALDIITTLAQAANADPDGATTPIPINIGASVAGITVNNFIQIIEPPQRGQGRPGSDTAVARTAQIRLMVRVDATDLLSGLQGALQSVISTALGLIGSVTGMVSNVDVADALKIGIDVEVARASAFLDRIDCPQQGVNSGMPIAQLSAETGVASVIISSFSGNAADAPPLDLGGEIPVATVSIDATNLKLLGLPLPSLGQTTLDSALAASSLGVSQTGPNPLPRNVTLFEQMSASDGKNYYEALGIPEETAVTGNPQTVGSASSVELDLDLDIETSGTGLTGGLADVAAELSSVINTTVEPLLSAVGNLAGTRIDPILGALGIQTGTAEVVMHTIEIDRPLIATTQRPQISP